jgi:hypothetical protein
LLVVLATAAGGMIDGVRMGARGGLPGYVKVAAWVCFAVLLVDLLLAAIWYGSLLTPSKETGHLTYDQTHVWHGSLLFFAFTAPTALLIAALREGVSRR